MFGTNGQASVRVAKSKNEVCFEAKRKAGAAPLYNQSETALLMTRKDSEKDSERPHYYSQFWLDIAAGKRTIGGPKPEDGEAVDTDIVEPVLQRRPGRASEPEEFHHSPLPANGYREEIIHPIADEEYSDAEEDLAQDHLGQDQEELNGGDYPDDLPLEDEDVPDVDLSDEEEENALEENALEENENIDYEEEDTEWGNRGRKKAKPTRPNKVPLKKPGKPRRGGF